MDKLTPEQFWAEILAFCQTTCDRISPKLLQDFGKVSASEKTDGSLITRADEWADGEICRAIAAAFPAHGILSEENSSAENSSADSHPDSRPASNSDSNSDSRPGTQSEAQSHTFPDTDWCWVIDPIDGTTDFTRGIPIWATSLGLLYQGTPVFGYINVPPLNQAFYGYWYGDSVLPPDRHGPTGAYCNGQPIQVDRNPLTPNHLFSFCTRSIHALQRDELRSQKFPCKIRMLGASTYNLLTVAMGATLGGVEATPKIWDIAAVWAIAQAAGATWIALDDHLPFPLVAQNRYSSCSYPTLAIAQPALAEAFRPFVQSVAAAKNH